MTTFLLEGLVEASIEPNCANSGATGRSPSGARTSPVSFGKRDGRGEREARQKTLTSPLSCSEQARYSLSLNTALAVTLNCDSPSPPGGEVLSPSSICCSSPDRSSTRDPASTLLRPSHSFGIPRKTALCEGLVKQMPFACNYSTNYRQRHQDIMFQVVPHLKSLQVCVQWEVSCQPCNVQKGNTSK